MKVSAKSQYALRAMVDLASNYTDEYIPLTLIAKNQGISVPYLEQIFSVLCKSGLIRGNKGARGGYSLTLKPSQITVGRILRAMEGESMIVDYCSQDA
ncbi:MAG: RrF2 family transcriptional regulator, partial [Candidatus Saccharibacteria bacterium]